MPTANKVCCPVRYCWRCRDTDSDDLILAVITRALLLAHELTLPLGFAYTAWPAGGGILEQEQCQAATLPSADSLFLHTQFWKRS